MSGMLRMFLVVTFIVLVGEPIEACGHRSHHLFHRHHHQQEVSSQTDAYGCDGYTWVQVEGDSNQLALFYRGVQVGNYLVKEKEYWIRSAPHSWIKRSGGTPVPVAPSTCPGGVCPAK